MVWCPFMGYGYNGASTDSSFNRAVEHTLLRGQP